MRKTSKTTVAQTTSPFSLKEGEDSTVRLTRITALWDNEMQGVVALLFTGESQNYGTRMLRISFGYKPEGGAWEKNSYATRQEFWATYRDRDNTDFGMKALRSSFKYFNQDSRKLLCKMISSAFRYAGKENRNGKRNGSSSNKFMGKMIVRFVSKKFEGKWYEHINAPREESQYHRGVGEKMSETLQKVNFFARAYRWFMS